MNTMKVRANSSRSFRSGINFPVGRVHRFLRKGKYSKRIGLMSAVYMAAVLEYLTSEILILACDAAHQNKRSTLKPRHIQLAIRNDTEIDQLLSNVIIAEGGVIPYIHPSLIKAKRKK